MLAAHQAPLRLAGFYYYTWITQEDLPTRDDFATLAFCDTYATAASLPSRVSAPTGKPRSRLKGAAESDTWQHNVPNRDLYQRALHRDIDRRCHQSLRQRENSRPPANPATHRARPRSLDRRCCAESTCRTRGASSARRAASRCRCRAAARTAPSDDQRQRDAERGHMQPRCRFEAEGATSAATHPRFGDHCASRTASAPRWSHTGVAALRRRRQR